MKKILIIAGAVIVVGVLVYLNLASNSGKKVQVQAEQAAKRELVETVSASGRIQPQTKVNITSEVTGEIIALEAKEGDYVKAGQALIVLDTVQLRSDVDQARFAVTETDARLDGAKVALDQATEEHERQKKLFAEKLTSETQFNNSKYAYLNAKSGYEAMVAQAKQYQSRYEKQLDNLEKAKIVAPIPGVITYVDCEVGEIAPAQTAFTQGKTLMIISNLAVFEVEVEVDETEINKVEMTQEAKIEIDAFPDTVFAGLVVEVGNTALITGAGTQDQSTNFKVKVILNDPDVKLRPGMSATVDIVTNRIPDALTVPYSSIVVKSLDVDSLEQARSREMASTGAEAETTGEVHAAETDEEATGDTIQKDTTSAGKESERKELKGVFVIKDGKAHFVTVETGIADQKNISITSGLAEGDSVVTGPYRILRTIKEGDEVEKEPKKVG